MLARRSLPFENAFYTVKANCCMAQGAVTTQGNQVIKTNSLYHKPVSAVTSKTRRSSRSGLSKIEDLPEQEDKRSKSKINKKQSSWLIKKLTMNNKEKIITESS